MLGPKEIDVINNSCIYDAYKGLYISEKEREKRLLQGIQPADWVLKIRWYGTNIDKPRK